MKATSSMLKQIAMFATIQENFYFSFPVVFKKESAQIDFQRFIEDTCHDPLFVFVKRNYDGTELYQVFLERATSSFSEFERVSKFVVEYNKEQKGGIILL